jgi:HEAT repeat protein
VEAVSAALADKQGAVRREGARALGQLGTGRLIPALIERLQDDGSYIFSDPRD